MKIIYPDCVNTLTAASEDADYLVANLLDDHPQKFWRAAAGVTTAVVSIVTTAVSVSGLGIAGTNAVSGTVTVKDVTEATTYETHSLSGSWGRFFVKFNAAYTEVLHITISLTATAAVYAGVLRCGTFISTADPSVDPKQKRNDHSIKKELSNGGLSVILRDMPRKYNLAFLAPKADYDSIDNLFLANGSLPLAILISDNIGLDDQWSGFFHITEPPDGGFGIGTYTGFALELLEAV